MQQTVKGTVKEFSVRNHFFVIRDSILASFLGIILGFIVDIIFPLPNKDENFFKSALFIIIQIILDGIILYYYALLYKITFNDLPDIFYGFSVFTVIFFLTQQQLLYRLAKIYYHFTNKSLD